ncbi:MAG: biotin--[acetyl-CoA-carboxylase] ligase [Bacteroidales bacterium]|jgi:BirA family biotin operon repressor/biotin-[acetyl-CoA-carboxylase] ligase|nr:biotin--[acetyl-CoA-carboxylase] ligase [Bacteroidales bacterium]
MCAKIIHVDVCESSNQEALKFTELLKSHTEFAISVKKQLAGRGMGKNLWHSTVGKNITVSFVKYPRFLAPDKQFFISMTSSLAVQDTLAETGVKSRIKWPNDILVGDEKISGILIENQISGDVIENTRIGIGLNVNENKFPFEISNPVSLVNLGFDVSPDDLVYELADAMDKWYYRLKEGHYSQIKKQYLAQLLGYKKYLKYQDDFEQFEAKIIDVNELGYLILQDKSHNIREYEMKTVKMIFE